MIRKNEPSRVESAHRTLMLLKFMAEAGSIGVTEAAQALEVNPSTAQRLLATLVGDGFAIQGAQRRYEPGPELLRPGTRRAAVSLRTRARPFLERLYGRVGETVHLATLIGSDVHHVDGLEANAHPIRFGLRVGVVLSAHVTSTGKAMLAELPREEVDVRFLKKPGDVERRVGDVDLAKLHRDLEIVRRQGFAVNFEESEDGVAAFGISLGSVGGERAAMSIAMPISRFKRSDLKRFAVPLLQTAEEFRKSIA